eukprot:2532294-Rhodomonas_salina.1
MPAAEAALQQLYAFAPQGYACPVNPQPSQMTWAAVNTLLSILKRLVFNERKVVWQTERNEAIRQLRWAIFLPKWFEEIAGPGGRKKTLAKFLTFTTDVANLAYRVHNEKRSKEGFPLVFFCDHFKTAAWECMVIAFSNAFENRYAIEGKDFDQDDGHDVIPPGLMLQLQPLTFARLAAVTKPFEPARPPPQLPNLEPADDKKQSHPAPAPPGKKQETTEERKARENKEAVKKAKWAQVNNGQNKLASIQTKLDNIEETLTKIDEGKNKVAGEKASQKGKLTQIEKQLAEMKSEVEKLKQDPLAHTDIDFNSAVAELDHDIPKATIRV